MPVITGKDGRVLINGVQPGELLDWELTVEESNIENAGQSDTWEYSVHLRRRWTARGRLELPLVNYQSFSLNNFVGSTVAVVLKIQASDGGSGFFAGAGRIQRNMTRAPQEDTVSQETEIMGQGPPSFM